ncbi:hypothetical protein K439DRAFT_798048 [Ramaria rubella]|nr:hypothetical protein K439DRAFT_798048 [Ramaria rubella]
MRRPTLYSQHQLCFPLAPSTTGPVSRAQDDHFDAASMSWRISFSRSLLSSTCTLLSHFLVAFRNFIRIPQPSLAIYKEIVGLFNIYIDINIISRKAAIIKSADIMWLFHSSLERRYYT